MIIDTNQLTDEELIAYGYLLSIGFRPNDNGEWNYTEYYDCELDYSKIFYDKKIIVKLGEISCNFSIFNNIKDETISLIGMPNICQKFDISGLKIKNIDFLPLAKDYDFEGCGIEKISYKFPEKIDLLNLIKNRLKNFKNFPNQVSILLLESNPIKTLKGIPIVDSELSIGDCSKLKDISDIKGEFETLWLENLPKLQSLPYVPVTCKRIVISNCPNLENVEGLLNMKENSKIEINHCLKIDYYTLLKSKAKICINNNTKKSNMSDLVISTYTKNGELTKIDMTRLEFEKALFEEMINGPRTYENISFKTNEVNQMLNSYVSSSTTIKKFNL